MTIYFDTALSLSQFYSKNPQDRPFWKLLQFPGFNWYYLLKTMLAESINSFISIKFPEESNETGSSSYRLLELADPNLLAICEGNNDLYIRGRADDEAVLCTDNQTFLLRELITSNMFLVVEKDSYGSSGLIVGRPSGTLEVTALARPPGIDQLLKALKDAPYNGGIEDEDFKDDEVIHVTKIYENVQASSKEIEECLKEQGVIIIKGEEYSIILCFIFTYVDHYRKLGNHLLCRFFELFFNTAILEDWNLSDEPLKFEKIWETFQQYEDEFPSNLAEFILQFYSSSSGKFDFVKTSRFLAEQFLCARSVWDQEDFMTAWEKSLNDLFKPELSDIKDMFLSERHPGSGRMELRKYLRSELPSDVENRFIALFRTRPRWQYDDLVPFINDLGKDTKELDAIVLKHGRVSTTLGVRFITPRSQLLD